MEIKNKVFIKKGWEIMKKNFWFLIGIQAAVFALYFLFSIPGSDGTSLITFIVNVLISLLLTSLFLRLAKGEKVEFNDLFDDFSWKIVGNFILATIVTSIFIVIGFAVLIVPGIIVGLGLAFTSMIILDKKVRFWEAIKISWKMTKGYRWKLFVFYLVLGLVNILGIIALGVGLLVTLPTTIIALSLVYLAIRGEEINKQEKNESDVKMSVPENEDSHITF